MGAMELKVRDVAKLLDISDKTVYRWIKNGVLPAYRVQDQYRVNRMELLEWVTAQKIPVSEEIFNETAESHAAPSLASAIEEGGVFYRIEGADTGSVLRCVVDTMRLPQEVDRDFLHRVLIAREKVCSTAIGGGIAVPHPRNPIVLHVAKPSVTLCFLEHPVDFGAMDGLPVHALFVLVSPTIYAHLQLLSRLAFALHDPGLRAVIDDPGTRERILTEVRRVEASINRKPAEGE